MLLETEQIVKAIEALVGPIRPVGESNTDNQNLLNLTQMCAIVNNLIEKIYSVGYDFQESPAYSEKQASKEAEKFLTEILITKDGHVQESLRQTIENHKISRKTILDLSNHPDTTVEEKEKLDACLRLVDGFISDLKKLV